MRKSIIIAVALIVAIPLIGILGVRGVEWYRFIHTPLIKADSPSQNNVIINFREGMSLTDLGLLLQHQQLINNVAHFVFLARFEGFTTRLQAGYYLIDKTDTPLTLLQKIVAGKVIHFSFTIVEGTTLNQIIEKLHEAPLLQHDISAETLQQLHDSYKVKAASMEGLFFPDTYTYKAGSSELAILKRAHQKMLQQLQKIWDDRAQDLPYRTPYELLTAASIIEKETAVERERSIIASVILNRLRNQMRLQMDPTVIYALGKQYTGKLTRNDMQVDNPYNTYRYHGLPPTPICLPSFKSIDAAAHPAHTDYLYYVAIGKGIHQFSETLQQQNDAILQAHNTE